MHLFDTLQFLCRCTCVLVLNTLSCVLGLNAYVCVLLRKFLAFVRFARGHIGKMLKPNSANSLTRYLVLLILIKTVHPHIS